MAFKVGDVVLIYDPGYRCHEHVGVLTAAYVFGGDAFFVAEILHVLRESNLVSYWDLTELEQIMYEVARFSKVPQKPADK